MKLLEILRILVFVAGFIVASIAALAFTAFLLTLVNGFKVGWAPQGPMDTGWGLAAVWTGAICFVAVMAGVLLIGLMLFIEMRRKNPEEH